MRDAILKRQQTLSGKVDKPDRAKAVMVAVDGSVWFDQARRLVWVQRVGDTAVPMPAYNRNVKAQAGVPVLLEIMEGAQFPVIRDLDVEVMANPAGVAAGWLQSAYLTDHHADHEPGGNDQMWLYPEAFTPLAVVPGTSGLTITVISGYYELNGVRTFFEGAVDQDISASQPSSGEHRFVAVYIDDANGLGTVEGTAVPDGTDAAEPTWPVGSIPLAVVDLDGDQTDIQLGRDIFNRRSFVTSGGGGSFTDFSQVVYVSKDGSDSNSNTGLNPEKSKLTINAAITAALALTPSATNRIRVEILDGGTYVEDVICEQYVDVQGESARLDGVVILKDDQTLRLREIAPSSGNNKTLIRKQTGSSASYAYVDRIDSRNVTGSTCLNNQSSGSVIFLHCAQMWVGAGNSGVGDQAAGFGHVHVWIPDLYLAGNNAVGIAGNANNASIIGYIDHILETDSSPTGTVAISVGAAGVVHLTCTQIIADTAYTVTAGGELNLICADVQGTRTGTATFEASEFTVGHPFSVRTVDKNKKSAWHSTIGAAITAASAGDVIEIGPGTYAENVTVNKAVTLIGAGQDSTIISVSSGTPLAISAAGAVVIGLTANYTATATGYGCTISANATLRRCRITSNGGTAFAINVSSGSATVLLDKVEALATRSGSGSGGLFVASGATVTLEGGTYQGNAQSISGTWRGWYQDATGKVVTPNYIPTPENYAFSRRLFTLTSGSNQIGFEDSQSTPYVPGGNFSLSTPANNYLAESSAYRHFLWLYNFHGSTPLYVQWSSSTAKNNLAMRWAVSPNGAVGGDTLAAEIRFWAVQSPGAADKYWALRFMQYKTSKPQYPLWAELCYGTGVTFPDPSVAIFNSSPFVAGALLAGTLTVNNPGTPSFGVDPINLSEGFKSLGGSGGLAGQPGSFKTVRFYIPPANFVQAWIDEMVIT